MNPHPAWILMVVMLAVAPAATMAEEVGAGKRVIVLGIDGMDYSLTRQLMEEGKLPNLAQLAEEGSFLPLQTTMPPLSPVAWSTFITGTNPGGHGVFDFLRRDPQKVNEGFLPEDAVSAVQQVDANSEPWPIPFTDFVLPPNQRQVLLRGGTPFWEFLADHEVDARIYKIAASFPVRSNEIEVLAGMGTPDVQGGYGSFTYVTTAPGDRDRQVSGGRILPARINGGVVQVHDGDRKLIQPYLAGPTNPYRASNAEQHSRQLRVPFEVYADQDAGTAAIVLQEQPVVLREGEWSRWLPVEFTLLSGLASVKGQVRFYLQEAGSELRLLASAVHLAPGTEGLASAGFDRRLERALGSYHTKGMAQMVKALDQGIISPQEYLEHSRMVLEEEISALRFLLEENRGGLLFVYFAAVDLDSHMFWKYHDPQHPAHTAEGEKAFGNHVVKLYQAMDHLVGMARQSAREGDQLYVISDHGFASQRYEFNLNTWLHRSGYLAYEQGVRPVESKFFSGVDWSRTRAFGVGFNGLYVNLSGREAAGAVAREDYDELVEELRHKLLALRHEGRQVFAAVYRPEDIYRGRYLADAPDLILGYKPPHGPSDDSVLGALSETVLQERMHGFTGHHAVDFAAVPGVLFTTRRLTAPEPRLEDVTATILREFDVTPPEQVTGRALY